MRFFLCRPNVSLNSGAGQLIRGQAKRLRADGKRVTLCCRRGALSFFLRSGFIARRPPADLETLAASSRSLVVDHGMRLRYADLVFIHNCASEAVRHVDRDDWRAAATEESEFFRELNPEAIIVANSELVRRALGEHFGLSAPRIQVEWPGFRRDRFGPAAVVRSSPVLRRAARRALGLAETAAAPVVGFVTSGDFRKRGLDIFLDAAAAIAALRPEVRFLVVGSKRLPTWAARHALVQSGRVLYRPKSTHPERWFAALDIFLYPARFEEFGLVVTEALALGIPVLTSRRVGASECLPPAYAPWLLDSPDAAAFADKAIALLDDPALRRRLGALGAAGVGGFDDERYVHATVRLMLERARLKCT
jgi:glycosyltransferase involved in cell wall biosynthesis